MLYTTGMNTILPDAVRPGPHYSFRADLKLNFWAFMAVVTAFATRYLLGRYLSWSLFLRAVIALSPLLPSLLYVRSIALWIGGMDELQRRIQLEACLFATTGTIFAATGISLLGGFGLLPTALQHGLGWEGTFAAIVLLYVLANIMVSRRYR